MAHQPRALDAELAHFAPVDFPAAVHNLHLPAVAGHADRADFIDVADPQMDAAGPGRFGKAVVGVVLVVREPLLPAFNQGRGDRLGADVHQPPLGKLVILQPDFPTVDGVEDVLGPGNQQPDNGTFLLGDGVEDVLRLGAL